MYEVETSIRLIRKGMAELQGISGANDFYHVPILLLSSGYERLIKCLLCLASIDEKGEIKEIPYEKKGRRGHDLDLLLNKLLEICEEKDYSSKFPAAKEDINLLKNDKKLRKIVSILSEFAQSGRYYNLDMFIDGKSDYDKSEDKWEELETAIALSRKDISKKIKTPGELGHIYTEINKEFIIVLEKFARALARLFTLGDFGKFAKQISPYVHDYLFLKDEELGNRDYRKMRI